MVTDLLDINFSKGVFQRCILGKHPQEKFEKRKVHRASSPLDPIHNDLMGPLPRPPINKASIHDYIYWWFITIHLAVFSQAEVWGFLASERLQRTCRDSVQDKYQNPLHRQWGGICEPRCPTSFLKGRYTTVAHNTLHSATKWSIWEEEHIPESDGHLHVACKISTAQAFGW